MQLLTQSVNSWLLLQPLFGSGSQINFREQQPGAPSAPSHSSMVNKLCQMSALSIWCEESRIKRNMGSLAVDLAVNGLILVEFIPPGRNVGSEWALNTGTESAAQRAARGLF